MGENSGMKAAARTDPGRVRTANEDSVFADPDAGLLMVADGMGGHAAGEVASELAVRTISGMLTGPQAAGPAGVEAPRMLREAIQRANTAIRTRAAEDFSLRGMGTTVVVVLAQDARLWLAHVGDSRIYLIRAGEIHRLTQDHSLVAQMVKAGQLTAGEARKHHLRNVITRSLGFEATVEPEIQTVEWVQGDHLLLCSDGLTGMLEDEEIARVITAGGSDLPSISQDLIAMANERGGTDNISVVLARNS
jgi:serine/threonine protein phosphatase PrpC